MTNRLLRELAKITRTKCDSYCRCRIIEKNSLSFSKWKRWQALNRLRAQWSVWVSRIFKLRRRKSRASVILGETRASQVTAKKLVERMAVRMTEYLNEIIQGDCLDVMRRMPNNSIDLTVTSPPYDNLRNYNGIEWDFEGIAEELYRVTKDGGVVVWVVGDA